jgi:3'(2'), 5'-bisphosphate nucleotidase
MFDWEHFLSVISKLAREAGAAILATHDLHTQAKSDGSPVTDADLAANQVIMDGLRALDASIPIISEESLDQIGDREHAELVWLVDPLDGTSAFVKGGEDYTVNIALVKDGAPILGVIFVPVSDTLYSGIVGTGAWKQMGDQPAETITVSNGHTPPVVSMSRHHFDPKTAGWLENFGEHQALQLSSSLKLCYVAEGTADIFLNLSGGIMEWDTAAGDAIVQAAGGVVINADSNELVHYNKPDLHNVPLVAARNRSILP